jgi:hypothetical protein
MASDVLRKMLTDTVESWKRLRSGPGPWLKEAFVLRCGVEGKVQPLPEKYPEGVPQYCFYNTFLLIKEFRNLRYCEGFVLPSRSGFPLAVHHAWALDEEDNIVDVTLPLREGIEYLGVPITLQEYRQWTKPRYTSVLDTGTGVNIPFIHFRCPDLLTAAEKEAYEELTGIEL